MKHEYCHRTILFDTSINVLIREIKQIKYHKPAKSMKIVCGIFINTLHDTFYNYPEQSTKTIVPCPFIISATSLKTLTIFSVLLEFSMKHISTLFFVRRIFFKSFASVISSRTDPCEFNLAKVFVNVHKKT